MIEETLVNRLLATPALTALVGDRIKPVRNDEDTALPALSYQLISRSSEYTHDGEGISSPRYQLTALGRTYAEAVAVIAACKIPLSGVRWPDGSSSMCENEMDGWNQQSRGTGVYVRRLDVVVVDP